ncbi:matrixin family metalloprotease [bacterium]|nr:matrixin family metalloprotease [bacterium]
MKKRNSLLLKALLSGLFLLLLALPVSAVNSCPGCGKTSVEESSWATATDFLSNTTMLSDVPVKMMCFDAGTDEKTVENLMNRVYGGWNNPNLYISGSRWTSVANPPPSYSQGEPLTLTYSFVPDGTTVPDAPPPNGFGNQTNTINAMMTTKFGSVAAGKAKFAQAFAQWEALTGIHYVEETNDDGAALFSSAGSVGVRGDIRISACTMDGSSNVLAYNWFPNTGDMVLDNAESWQSSSNDYRFFRNVVTHEHGHGMGLSHVCPPNCVFLMEPFLCTAYNGPQHDDIRGAQRNYGDTNEPNDNTATATTLGSVPDGTTNITNVSNDDNSDTDYYSFTVPFGKQVTITMSPVGLTFEQCAQDTSCTCSGGMQTTTDDANLAVRLYDTNGTTILAEASSQVAGVNEVIANTALPAAGTYYIRVYADNTNAIQLYNLAFTISTNQAIGVTSPNGGESWDVASAHNITWNSVNVTGNVLVELNRDYGGVGSWETIIASTPNDGSQSWTVTGTTSSANCRARVTSISSPGISDISDANFTINGPSVTVHAPNGLDVIDGWSPYTVVWSSVALTGDFVVELNRSYPSISWENLGTFSSSGPDITFGGPATTSARIRVTSVSMPSAGDTSNGDFTITYVNAAPVIAHDQHGDAAAGSVTFTALITDDHGPIYAELNFRPVGAGSFTALAMPATGNPNEFAASPALTDGAYEYFIRADDGVNNSYSDTLDLDVETCSANIAFDDGTAEGYNYSIDTQYAWAIKYEAPGYPFMLCSFDVAIAKTHPDLDHSPIHSRVLLADGPLGSPGTVVWQENSGSIGNVIGGLPLTGVQWAKVITTDLLGDPILVPQAFYVAVDNPAIGEFEAFGRDDNTPSTNSYFYDGCESVWYNENDAHANAQGGQRMIRLSGASIEAPSELVIIPSGADIKLFWNETGAPFYHIYSSSTSDGTFATFVASTPDTFFTEVGVIAGTDMKFYQVSASATP